MKAVILEERKIIGNYGFLPSWDPCLFNLDDKEVLPVNKCLSNKKVTVVRDKKLPLYPERMSFSFILRGEVCISVGVNLMLK